MVDYLEMSLEERMSLAQSGDKQAYNSLLVEIDSMLRGFFRSKLNSDDDAEDVVQETLISVHNARHTYDGGRPFKPWLFSIAKFRLYDHLRKLYKRDAGDKSLIGEMDEYVSEDVTFAGVNNEELDKAMSILSEKQKNIVKMVKIEGYTSKEAANKLGMTESAVKVSVHRALKAMQEKAVSREG